jgi:hypothetical protein
MAPGDKWNRTRAASVSTSFRRLEIRGELRRHEGMVKLTPRSTRVGLPDRQ